MQGEQVEVEVYHPQNGDWAGSVDLEVSLLWPRFATPALTFDRLSQVGFNNKKTVTNETYDSEELSHVFINVSVFGFVRSPIIH